MIMETKEVLKDLGLSEGEAKVYLALLRLGESQVNKIKIETKMHRTTIYDFIDKLIKKGLVSYVVKNNVKFFSASHPSNLESLIKEKKERLEEALPNLVNLAELEQKSLKVEVFEGFEGFKTVMNKILSQEKEEFLSFGIDEEIFDKKFPNLIKSYMRKEEKAGIKERVITRKGTRFVYKNPHIKYKYMDEKFFSPTPIGIFSNFVGFFIWEPFSVVVIENKDLADAYRKHFELMWKIAERKA